MKISPYLHFRANCAEAFKFYAQSFKVGDPVIMTFADSPMPVDFPTSEADQAKVMHASLPIGDFVLLGSDTPDCMMEKMTIGANFSVCVQPETRVRADEIFAALSAGGTVKMPMRDMEWNAYFGMLTDKFGISWMINCELS